MASKLPYEEHERYVAELLGGRISKSSGRGKTDKGDGKNCAWLWDCKSTEKSMYSLTGLTLAKLLVEASREGRSPILPVRFVGSGSDEHDDIVVLVDGVRPLMVSGGDFPKSMSLTRDSIGVSNTIKSGKFAFVVRIEDLCDWAENNNER